MPHESTCIYNVFPQTLLQKKQVVYAAYSKQQDPPFPLALFYSHSNPRSDASKFNPSLLGIPPLPSRLPPCQSRVYGVRNQKSATLTSFSRILFHREVPENSQLGREREGKRGGGGGGNTIRGSPREKEEEEEPQTS